MKRGEKKKKGEHYELFENPEISFKIQNYDDVYSDFDPREHHQRALSSDFLEELRRASVDKRIKDKIALDFFVQSPKRNREKEKIIINRLKGHFIKHFILLKNERMDIIRKGWRYVFFGVIIMFLASWLLFSYKEATLLMTFLVILLEPAGWFLFWEGFGMVIFETKEKEHEYIFYKKMRNSTIRFISE